MIAERVKAVGESPTLALKKKIKEAEARGIRVIDFGAGQPDFDAPMNVKVAAARAIKEGNNRYTEVSGLPELKEAICSKLWRENRIKCRPENIMVSCGAKHSLYNIMQAIINPGDEVIIPSPYWVSYPEMVKLAGGRPVFAETWTDFKITKYIIEQKISPKTGLLVLNSPCNPTGSVIPRDELVKIAELCLENEIMIISDEIYEKIIYDERHVSIASLREDVRDITFTVNGLSKSHAIPGWRLGYAAGPEQYIREMEKIQGQSTSNPASIVQIAAIEALKGPQDFLKDYIKEYRERRDFVVKRLNEIRGFSCNTPEGAFYVFPQLPVLSSEQFAQELLEKAGVAVVPGRAFGRDGYIRISYATSMENLEKGLERIEGFVG